jgi:hypothetical protein
MTPDDLARMFHESYERRAPDFGYETRTDSAVPWEDVPEPNKGLMVAVAGDILDRLVGPDVPFDHANDPAVRSILMDLADDFHEMNDGDDPPFDTATEGNVMTVRPDPDPENWGDEDGPIAAPTSPVVRITVERIA